MHAYIHTHAEVSLASTGKRGLRDVSSVPILQWAFATRAFRNKVIIRSNYTPDSILVRAV